MKIRFVLFCVLVFSAAAFADASVFYSDSKARKALSAGDANITYNNVTGKIGVQSGHTIPTDLLLAKAAAAYATTDFNVLVYQDGVVTGYKASSDDNDIRGALLAAIWDATAWKPCTIRINGHFTATRSPYLPLWGHNSTTLESSGPNIVTLDTNTASGNPASGDKWEFGAGGTLIVGTQTETIFAGNTTANDTCDISINNCTFRNLGFKKIGKVFDVGAENHSGFYSSKIENIYVNNCAYTPFTFANFQFLAIEGIRMRDVNGGIFGYTQHKYYAGGNSLWNDIMIIPRALSPYGIKLGAYDTVGSNSEGQLNYISGNRWQVNAFASSSPLITADLLIDGNSVKHVQFLSLYALDLEGSYVTNKFDANYMYSSNISFAGANKGSQLAHVKLRNSPKNVLTSSDSDAILDFDAASAASTIGYGEWYDVTTTYLPCGFYRIYNTSSTIGYGMKLVGAGDNGKSYRIDVSPSSNPWLMLYGAQILIGATNKVDTNNITKWDGPRVTVNNAAYAEETLPTAVGYAGMEYTITKISSTNPGVTDVNICVKSGEYLGGVLNGKLTLDAINETAVLRADGVAGWMIVMKNF